MTEGTSMAAEGSAPEVNRGCFIALGVIVVILGIAALGSPFVTGFATTMLLGWILIFAGIARAISGIFSKGRSLWLDLLVGVLYVIVGIILLRNPLAGQLTITIFLAFLFIIEGVFEVVEGFRVWGQKGAWWLLIGGILALVLGLLIFFNLPGSALITVGVLVGIYLIFAGIGMIFGGPAAMMSPRSSAPSASY